MHSCEYCKSELPSEAHFCGVCGYVQDHDTDMPTHVTLWSEAEPPARIPSADSANEEEEDDTIRRRPAITKDETTSSLAPANTFGTVQAGASFSGAIDLADHAPTHPSTEMVATFGRSPRSEQSSSPPVIQWPITPLPLILEALEDDPSQPTLWSLLSDGDQAEQPTRPSRELDTPHLEFGLALSLLAAEAPPSVGAVPMVQGTPQPSGAPMVQGSLDHHQPSHHLQQHHQGHSHQASVSKSHLLHRHAATAKTAGTATKVAGATSKLAAGLTAKWLIVAIVGVVVLASLGLGLVLTAHPSLSFGGSSKVVAGGVLQLHGSGFIPGNSVTLTLDHNQPVSFIGHSATGKNWYGSRAFSVAALETNVVNPLKPSTPFDGTVGVNLVGTFDANVIVSKSWSIGSHILSVTEGLGSRSAELPFTILAPAPPPAQLSVNPQQINFGEMKVGAKAVSSIIVRNTGGQALQWTADAGEAPWLTLNIHSGTIQPGGQQVIYVTIDTSHLKVGTYSASLHFRSNSEEMPIQVSMQLVSSSLPTQAKLDVNPLALNFGQLAVGQQASQVITIGNLGTKVLNWSADTTGTTWLKVDITSGMIQSGGLPETVTVSVDTTNLTAGPYSAVLTINSTGGKTDVGVTLLVTTLSPTPDPTLPPVLDPTVPPPPPDPTVPPPPTPTPIWSVAPGSLDATNCSGGATWTCTLILTESATSQSPINWSVTGALGESFNPAVGTLSPGLSRTVNISGIPCQNDTFTFSNSSGAPPLAVPWSCSVTLPPSPSPTPPPTWSVNPNSLGPSNCSGNTTWTCTVFLTEDPTSQVGISWSSSSDQGQVGFNPSNAQLAPGQTMPVIISNIPCNHASFTFTGSAGANPVMATWNCTLPPPTLTVTPNSLSPSNCSNTGGGWTCTVTLSVNQGSVNWFASSTSASGINISPSIGTVSAGQPVPVTIVIVASCPFSATITFGGGANPVDVPWNC